MENRVFVMEFLRKWSSKQGLQTIKVDDILYHKVMGMSVVCGHESS